MNTLEKCAEILVACGYAEKIHEPVIPSDIRLHVNNFIGNQPVNPFVDTLEGRRQADAIEDWLILFHTTLWKEASSGKADVTAPHHNHQWRLDRIEWCIQEEVLE